MVVGNLIQVGLQVQGRMEGTSVSNTTLLCWLEERLYNQHWETHQLPELCLRWVSHSFSSRWEIVTGIFQLDEAVESGGLGSGKGSGEFSFAVTKAFAYCR